MKKRLAFAAVILSGSLAACSSPDSEDTGGSADAGSTVTEPDETQNPNSSADAGDSSADGDSAADSGNIDGSDSSSDTGASGSSSDDGSGSDGGSAGSSSADADGSGSSGQNGSDDQSMAVEQKQMAIDTLKGLIKDGKEGKVYHLTDKFYVGNTTQTDVYNEIGKPERQDTFDRYTGSMGNPSYDLRYNNKGVLVEARYGGTNVERQTNLGGITSEDIIEQLGQPDDEHSLPKTKQVSYAYDLGDYEMQFILNDKDTTDHVNLLMK